jgi:hypothetical protein
MTSGIFEYITDMITDYPETHEHIRLQILKDRYDLQRLKLEKTEALSRQQFEKASAILSESRAISNRLESTHEQLSSDYHRLDLTPSTLLSIVHINSLLSEFNDSDPSLPMKLHTLHEYLHTQQLEAINSNDEPRAAELAGNLRLVSDAISDHKHLNAQRAKKSSKILT